MHLDHSHPLTQLLSYPPSPHYYLFLFNFEFSSPIPIHFSLCCPIVEAEPALECGQLTKGHAIKDNWLYFPTAAYTHSSCSRISCPSSLFHIVILSYWVCIGLFLAITIAVKSYVSLPCCIWKTLFPWCYLPLLVPTSSCLLSFNDPWYLSGAVWSVHPM